LAVITPFTFKGRIGRAPYAAWSVAIFLSQYLIPLYTGHLDVLSYLIPHRALRAVSGSVDFVPVLGAAYLLIVAWVLAALALRRANDANLGGWVAAFAITPVVQIPVILVLCFAPSGPHRDLVRCFAPDREARTTVTRLETSQPILIWASAAQGVLAGVALTLVFVAVGTLVFGNYGSALFLLTPFVVGAVSAYIANHRDDIGGRQTALTVAIAVLLGSLMLLAFALEGIVCIIMAAPLGVGMALIGGVLGRAMAVQTRRPAGQPLQCIALLPLMFAVENVLPPVAHFETEQTIVVAAPPDAVWQSILSTDSVEGPLALPFRLGVAYPIRGEVLSEGVGAVRYGEFSTGTAIERMTEWVPNRKLAFVIVRDIPGMRELSPYEHVHAPHVIGYFRTISTSFELVPRSDGGTDIVERSSHELRLDPVPYWLPMAQWIVRENNARVLAHIRAHAERGFRSLKAHPSLSPSP
jgi:uncharacterized membrane protein YhaH (DUF805 family)